MWRSCSYHVAPGPSMTETQTVAKALNAEITYPNHVCELAEQCTRRGWKNSIIYKAFFASFLIFLALPSTSINHLHNVLILGLYPRTLQRTHDIEWIDTDDHHVPTSLHPKLVQEVPTACREQGRNYTRPLPEGSKKSGFGFWRMRHHHWEDLEGRWSLRMRGMHPMGNQSWQYYEVEKRVEYLEITTATRGYLVTQMTMYSP